jgi:hypothetical protein
MESLIKSSKRILDKDCQRPLYKHLFLELFAVGYEDFCGKTIVGLQHEQKYKHAKIKIFLFSPPRYNRCQENILTALMKRLLEFFEPW